MLEKVQRAVTKHIGGMKGLSYEQRLEKLGWTTLEARRERGDLILTYQCRKGNAEANLSTWHWVDPLIGQSGPVSSIRANNEVRLYPPAKYNNREREHFLTTRVAGPLRALPVGLIDKPSVNAFKNAYDQLNKPS